MGLWGAATGQLLRTLVGRSGLAVRCIRPPDGQTTLSTSLDKKVALWEAATGQLLESSMGTPAPPSPDGKPIVAGFEGGVVKMWR